MRMVTEAEMEAIMETRVALVVEPTPIGKREIMGRIRRMLIEEVEGKEVVTAVTIEGLVTKTLIEGLMPIEEEEPITLTMIGIEHVELVG